MRNNLYTILIQGGTGFTLALPGNPEVSHDGSTSTFHLYLNAQELLELGNYLSNFNCSFEYWSMSEQSPEQEKERLKLLGAQKQDAVFPSAKCTSCSWFDPLIDSYCGLKEWPIESIGVLETQQSYISSKDRCDIPEYWQ